MKENLLPVLINLGLDSKESKIYLALTELGQASVLNISRRSKVNRASIYYILEKMKKRGLVSHVKKEGTDYFLAVQPDLLLAQQKSRVKDFQSIIPELKSLSNLTGEKPSVRFYEGLEGIKHVYADTLTSKTEILNYANSRDVRDHWPEYDQEYVTKRAEKKIPLRGIAPDDDYGRQVKRDDKQYFRKIRLIDPRKINFGNEIHIYDSKTAMISFSSMFAVIIESRALTDTQRSIFEMAWGFAGGQ